MAMLVFTGGIALWNKLLLWDDDEAEEGIAEYVKQRGYIAVLPPNKDHQVHYIRAATATRDILEWAGVADWPDVWKDFKSGQISLAKAMLHAPKAAVNKVVQGMGPGKSAMEIAFGKSLFPDLFEPQPLRSIDTALFRAWGIDREWQAVKDLWTPVPSKGAGSYWMGLLGVKKNDPGLGAYAQVMDLKGRFEQNVLNRGGSFGDYHTPKSDLARQYRLAKKWGDQDAEERILSLMRQMGMRRKDIEHAMKVADPLYGLSRLNEKAFREWLTPAQARLLGQAQIYYESVFESR